MGTKKKINQRCCPWNWKLLLFTYLWDDFVIDNVYLSLLQNIMSMFSQIYQIFWLIWVKVMVDVDKLGERA